jgi:hypothetical protein
MRGTLALQGGEEVRGVLEGIEQTYGGIFAFKYLIGIHPL